MSRARSTNETARHPWNAAWASATTRSISPGGVGSKVATTSPVAGLIDWIFMACTSRYPSSVPPRSSECERFAIGCDRLDFLSEGLPMTRAYNVIDADGHILVPVDLWDKYMDPEF